MWFMKRRKIGHDRRLDDIWGDAVDDQPLANILSHYWFEEDEKRLKSWKIRTQIPLLE